ncbi:MAG: amylo-alpha-1,6-glucosidase [Planctomycetota bacterium]
MDVVFGHEECVNTESALRKEWLETNGRGGWASSTIVNCHTRKYHGLLVSALADPPGRFVLLSKVDASIVTERKEFRLATNKFPGVYEPTGHKYIDSFRYTLYPECTFRVGDIVLRQSIIMPYGMNVVYIKYELLEADRPVTLRLKPLLAYRHVHALTRANMDLQVRTFFVKNGFKIEPYKGMPPLFCTTSRLSEFFPAPDWIRNFEYLKEERRGYPYQEDLFSPGVFEITLKKNSDITFAASTRLEKSNLIARRWALEVQRRRQVYDRYANDPPHLHNLKYIAGQFIFRNRKRERSVIAGYHWFGEWGRDTMIALPGLAFYTGRVVEGLDVLRTWASKQKDGLLPNCIGDDGTPAYNSGDASLWFFWTVQEYLRRGGDRAIVRERFFDTMEAILKAVLEGRAPHFRLLEDGLLQLGDEHTQLTWMDATVDGRPVTPRHGCPVEINALWYNALRFYADLCRGYKCRPVPGAHEAAERLAAAFGPRFWNAAAGCLADTVRDGAQDTAVRPNQIFAVSLPHSALTTEQKKAVVDRVTRDLVTPFGLRTLSPADDRYQSEYEGDQPSRDRAYHQGTVWPWLVGPYGEACLRTARSFDEGRRFLRKRFAPLLTAFPRDFCVTGLYEIANGSPPHKPKGAIHQAWSVGEVIRLNVLLEEGRL